MTTRNTLLAVTAAALIAAGIWWFSQSAPAPVATQATATPTAPVTPAPKVSDPVAPPKPTIAAPLAPPVVPSVKSKSVENPAPAPSTDADLSTAVNDLITTLVSGDANAIVQLLAPSVLETAKKAATRRMAQNPNVTPEMLAQMEQMMEQQAPQMVQMLTQEMTQNPSILQRYQQMGDALKQAQGTPPTMNAAGDQATYTLQSNGETGVPPTVVMTLRDGKWTLDFAASMMQNASGGQ